MLVVAQERIVRERLNKGTAAAGGKLAESSEQVVDGSGDRLDDNTGPGREVAAGSGGTSEGRAGSKTEPEKDAAK